jgi:ATP-dependent RNA helicase MSS116
LRHADPDVTAVIQVGAPTDRSQYIHRLGRTARAGKQGDGVLLLAPFDAHVLNELSDLPIARVEPVAPTPVLLAEVARGLAGVDPQSAAQCYGAHAPVCTFVGCAPGCAHVARVLINASPPHAPRPGAWLGEKNGSIRKMGWDKPTLVRWANAYALTLGCRSPPPLSRKTVGKMGLKGALAARAALPPFTAVTDTMPVARLFPRRCSGPRFGVRHAQCGAAAVHTLTCAGHAPWVMPRPRA